MTAPQFGSLVQCRTCHGTGVSRNPSWGDRDLARQRERERRHKQYVERPTELVPCVECGGGGFMQVEVADKPKLDREELKAVSVLGERAP